MGRSKKLLLRKISKLLKKDGLRKLVLLLDPDLGGRSSRRSVRSQVGVVPVARILDFVVVRVLVSSPMRHEAQLLFDLYLSQVQVYLLVFLLETGGEAVLELTQVLFAAQFLPF